MNGLHLEFKPHELKPKESRLFQDLVYKIAGIRMDDRKHALIQNRLRKRLIATGMQSYREYYDYIISSNHADELQECLNQLTTNETFFFRHKNQWDFFTQVFIPEWIQSHKNGDMIRIWSAAASTGEEAYSSAIALYELMPHDKGFHISIEATDINQDVLDRAERGVYREYAVQKLTKACLTKYFQYDEKTETYMLCDTIRKLVRFKKHNLLLPTHGPPFDLIFIRNVMIYFDDKSKEIVIQNIAKRLKTGYVILGGAETLSSYEKW
ncbi:MAG: protein-glutamate O-methyltransferase CheR, partial [Desulfobacterales bacterium]|nr:protein-glutamate O-methyltransferase CheR [Desulfobacterales bacterium]